MTLLLLPVAEIPEGGLLAGHTYISTCHKADDETVLYPSALLAGPKH